MNKEISPHGSKKTEVIRYLANQFLTDSQRKRIKTFLAKLQQVPLRALGIEALINDQKSEIERLKSRITILDGKLNIALYGMPSIDEKYRAVSMSNSFQNRLAFQAQSPLWPFTQGELNRLASLPLLQRFAPKAGLVIGRGVSVFSQVKGSRLFYSDTDPSWLIEAQENLGHSAEILKTDPMTSLFALSEAKLDWIQLLDRYQSLAPSEQSRFLQQACECLNPGGVLVVGAPNQSDSEVVRDLYWSDSRNLRPYSPTLIEDSLTVMSGQWEKIEGESRRIYWVFRKSENRA